MGRLPFLVNRVQFGPGPANVRWPDLVTRNLLNQIEPGFPSMLACFLEGPRRIVVREVPVPGLGEGDVLIRMGAGGICGTDLEKVEGQLGPGGILGHEVSGTVEKVSESVVEYGPGDRVVAHHHVPCYHCMYCLKGDPTMCSEFKSANFDPCGFAEYFRLPKFNVSRGGLVALPKSLTFEEGAMIEPTACCIRALQKAQVHPDDNILVVGLGPTGLTHIQLVRRATRGQIIGTDIVERRLREGERIGADETIDPRSGELEHVVKKLTHEGVDLAIAATGNEKALDQAFASVRKGGKILLFGAPAQGAAFHLNVSEMFARQISVLSSYSCVESEMHEAIKLVRDRAIDLKGLITDRFPVSQADKALEHARTSSTAIKTMIAS